jgi:hypothetical protein
VVCRGGVYRGEHEPIVDPALFAGVQRKLVGRLLAPIAQRLASPKSKEQYNLASWRGTEVRNFLGDDVFDPGTVSMLMAAFDSAWQSIQASGAHLSEKQSELVRATLAKYIVEQARRA